MKKIGITGGIGSGKTTVMRFLESLGYPAYYSDVEAKKLMNKPHIIKQIQNVFLVNILNDKGLIDRKKIASIVFKDHEKLQQLNQIVHPAVRKDFENFVIQNKKSKAIFYESALLVETKGYKFMDVSILITAPLEVRIQRVLQRDGISVNEVKSRINNQLPDAEKQKFIDYSVENLNFDKTKIELLDIINILKL